MANKKITQLNPITSGSLSDNDLFVVVDVDAGSTPTGETKKITSADFYGYLRDAGFADSSSYSVNSISSSYSFTTVSSSHSQNSDLSTTSSYALTASYALNAVTSDNISSEITLQVTKSGDDSTGNQSAPFETLEGAFSWLNERLITSGGFVNIHIANDEYTYSNDIVLHHPNGNRISVVGNGGVSFETIYKDSGVTLDNFTVAGNENFTASFAITNGNLYSEAEVGDYLLIVDTSQNTLNIPANESKNRGLCGMWEIISTSTLNKLKVFVDLQIQSNSVEYDVGSNTFTAYLIKTKFKFSGCNGFVIDNCNIHSIKGLAIIGESQFQSVGNGGNGLSAGRMRSRLDTRLSTSDILNDSKGIGSANCELVGIRGFAYSGFSAANGSLTCYHCGSSKNYYGFSSENGSFIDIQHCVSSANTLSGVYCANASSMKCQFSSIAWNKYFGLYAIEGGSINADSIRTSVKCNFVGFNGETNIYANRNSVISLEGSVVYGNEYTSSLISTEGAAVMVANNSSINADYTNCLQTNRGFFVFNNSTLKMESSYFSVREYAGEIIRNSSAILGNSYFLKNSNVSGSSRGFLDVNNSSTLTCPGLKLVNGLTVDPDPNFVKSVVNIINNSSLQTYTFYSADATKLPSTIALKPNHSLDMLNEYSGSALSVSNRGYAYIRQLTSSINTGYYDVSSTYGGYIIVNSPDISTLSTYPSQSVPFDSNLSMVRND